MNSKICPTCNQPLPEWLHGNRRYHPQCDLNRKKSNNAKRYSTIKKLDNEALRLDKILKSHFMHSNGTNPIPKSILESEKFKWDFVTSMTSKNPPIFWILDYGYSFADNNKKIVIYYGNNPL
jgi:hypothetical protein